jgi:predicted negative regulator of RcsB-dependent stress response
MEITPLEVFVAGRITRKELKTDKFAIEVEQTVGYVTEHRAQVLRYGAMALALLVIAVAIYYYRQHQHTARQQALSEAVLIQEAPVGPPNPGSLITFPTDDAKRAAAAKAFNDLAAKYAGTAEGAIAQYYLGASAADQANNAEAEKRFKLAVENGGSNYSSLAQLSLAQIYFATGRAAEAEKLLRSLMDHPTIFVSKEAAAITLARGIGKAKPDEARKILEPLRTERSAVSQAAISALAELTPR